jgi:two-component system LytT family response regulator
MSLKCIALDDEPLALELLEDNINRVPFLQLQASFTNPVKAIEFINTNEVDVVFLDIQMPGLTGLQLIKSLSKTPLFILVTAYDNFALAGFDLDVVDYLLKPVSFDRFLKACNKANEIFISKASKNISVDTAPSYFFVQADYKQIKVEFDDILFFEGLKDYVKIHLAKGAKPIVTRMSMKTLEDLLPVAKFLRIHKSYIISKKAIASVQKNIVQITEHELPVGELYKEQLQSFINAH